MVTCSGKYLQVVSGLDAEFLLDLEECFDGWDYVEDGYVCSCFCEAFCECETAASSSACDESRSAFERELRFFISVVVL